MDAGGYGSVPWILQAMGYPGTSQPSPVNGSPMLPDGSTNTDDTPAMLRWLQTLPDRPGARVGVPAAPGSSPFQVGLERAISQEMAKPQGQYVSTSQEFTRSPTYRYNDFTGYTPVTAGEPSQLAEMISAGAQKDAAMNAGQGQRLHSMLGAYGQIGQANADQMRARTEKETLDYAKSPEGQKARIKNELVKNAPPGAIPGSAYGAAADVPLTNDQLIRSHFGLPEGAPIPEDLGPNIETYDAAGGPPVPTGTPLYGALMGHDTTARRAAGMSVGALEHMATWVPGHEKILGAMGLSPESRYAAPTRRMLGVQSPSAAATSRPGVPTPVGKETPVAKAKTEAEIRQEMRNFK